MEHITSREQLAQLLERLRQRSGLSYRQVAQATGLSTASLWQWGSGSHWPQMDKLGVLLDFYGETVTLGRDPDEEER